MDAMILVFFFFFLNVDLCNDVIGPMSKTMTITVKLLSCIS